MHGKSHLPMAEAAVLPLRQPVAPEGENGNPAGPAEPQVSMPAEGADGTERYQVDRAVHAMLARLSGGISPALGDHVAPWRSVYKIHYQVDADVTFLLTSGGHNAGIVAPPGEAGHTYRVKTKTADATYVGPDEWPNTVPQVQGSWWPEWTKWLAARSGKPSEPPPMGCETAQNLPDAPTSPTPRPDTIHAVTVPG
jgi:Poly-beta-hydroxybutyrate polymerase N terminal